MDHHVPAPVTAGLRRRGVDVITAFEDHNHRLSDPDLLTRASQLGRAFVSMDRHLPAEAARRQRSGEQFAGLLYAQQSRVSVGQLINDLELIAKIYDPPEMLNRVEYLPLK
jgi:hypothetical protein